MPINGRPPAKLQPKLTINAPGDEYEQEADRIADQVMRMPDSRVQRACACGGGCPECQSRRPQPGQEEEHLRAKAMREGDSAEGAAPPLVQQALRSPGQRLAPATREFMESRFGHDFSLVRVHTDAKAARSARAVNALAYTVGQDIAFGAGLYAPQTSEGRRLLAHELTHVVHQRPASRPVPRARRPGAVLQRKNGRSTPAKETPPIP